MKAQRKNSKIKIEVHQQQPQIKTIQIKKNYKPFINILQKKTYNQKETLFENKSTCFLNKSSLQSKLKTSMCFVDFIN